MKTLGQIAYEAYERHFGRDGKDWNDQYTPQNFRNGWEAAAKAIADELADQETQSAMFKH